MTGGRLAVWALVAIHAMALAAPVLSPYPVDDANRDLVYAPPTPIRVTSESGACCTAPWIAALTADDRVDGVLSYRVDREAGRGYLQVGAAIPDTRGIVRHALVGVPPPHRLLVLGADGYGRDLLSRLLHGGRLSLFTGLAATGAVLLIALAVGLATALGPPSLRSLLAGMTDLMLVLPWLYLLLAFRAMLPLSLPATWAMLAIVAVLVAAGWARTARVVAGEARTLATAAFLDAARASGATSGRIIWHHVLPHTWSTLAAQALVILPQFVLAEVTLSFLGLGLGEPTPSLGGLLLPLREPGTIGSYWWMASPAVALVALFALYHASARALAPAGWRA